MTSPKKTTPSGSERDEAGSARALLHDSHLAPSASQASFTEFEFALHHIAEAFSRWSSALHESVSGEVLPVADVSVLQLIRMNERPKSAAEIGKFLNRDDSSNILYALRKLERAGLIEKTGTALRQTAYQVTEAGRDITDRYAKMRREILLDAVDRLAGSDEQLASVTQTMWRISGLYEQAARTTAMVRMLQPDALPAAVKAPPKRPRKGRQGSAAA